MKAIALSLLVASVGLACSDHDRPKLDDTEHHSHPVDPPAKAVRALPPHAIHADGVGPYKLGASLSELNDLLRSGPHLAQIDIPHVIRVSVLRAEDDAILIGGEPQGKATFVSVVGAEVARTESGAHVGVTRDELIRALGPPALELDRARDPRLVAPASMPELRAVLDKDDRVIGLVVAPPAAAAAKEPGDGCVRPALEGSDAAHGTKFGACLSGSADVVTLDGDELSIRAQDDKPLASLPLHGATVVFAAPLRASDGRDELYVVTRVDEPATRTWSLAGYRLDHARLVPVVEPKDVYQLTAANARWIGSELHDLDLYLELASGESGIEVGGLLTTHVGTGLRDLLVLAPVQVPRVHRKSPASEAGDAGIPDANPNARDPAP
ncbi:MAG TPA: hypothetical protein VGG74_17975 [Kofleriaceae bacterium]